MSMGLCPTRAGAPLLSGHRTELTIVVLDYVLKSVNVFAFTNKLKLVLTGNELELWIASLTTRNFNHSTE